jgi:iron complex transport system substrate-binding protein
MPQTFVLPALMMLLIVAVSGCVNQYPEKASGGVARPYGQERVVATSRASVDILNRLDVAPIGAPKKEAADLNLRADVTGIGSSMEPDTEIIRSLAPDWVFSPVSLEASLKPRYEAARIDAAFLNLRSVAGMYRSVEDLGKLLGREQQANELIAAHERFYADYQKQNANRRPVRVLVLMGFPGSYVVATDHSYVGSLVKMAGGVNVYADEPGEFVSINTEDMLTRKPEVILRASHALPQEVVEMFDKEFAENDTWKHFDAVAQKRVFDLPYKYFGMSATFTYPEALRLLQTYLYPQS